MSAVAHDVHAGLNGWHRYGYWAAHFFVNGEQSCKTKHGRFDGKELPPRAPELAELTPGGLPYGKVCARCRKLAAQAPGSESGK